MSSRKYRCLCISDVFPQWRNDPERLKAAFYHLSYEVHWGWTTTVESTCKIYAAHEDAWLGTPVAYVPLSDLPYARLRVLDRMGKLPTRSRIY